MSVLYVSIQGIQLERRLDSGKFYTEYEETPKKMVRRKPNYNHN
jgi:hypothetical protein